MSSFFRWSSTPVLRLSLDYFRDFVQIQSFTANNKQILCECFKRDDDIDDYQKLAQFLHLQRHELYPAIIANNSAIEDVIKFMKEFKTNGYKSFICIVEYEIKKKEVLGNHYIVGFDRNIEIELQVRHLRARRLTHMDFYDSHCIVLKNYTHIKQKFPEWFFSGIIDDFLRDPIVLGKMVSGSSTFINDRRFNAQTLNLRTYNVAKELLQSIRRRLNLPKKFQLTTDKKANITVFNAFTMLEHCASTLQNATDAFEIKNTMHTINDQLITFVSNFYCYLRNVYDGGSIMANHDGINDVLHNIDNCIGQLNYVTVNNVFCMVYDHNTEEYTKPVIHVTDSNFNSLLSAFQPKGCTTLKFRLTDQTDEDDDWLLETETISKAKVNLTWGEGLIPSRRNAVEGLNYVTSCVHEPDKDYHWICIYCETLIKVNQQAKIMCKCGVGMNPIITECYKCVANNRRVQIPVSNITTTYDIEFNINNQKSDDLNREVIKILPVAADITAEPVSYSVRIVVIATAIAYMTFDNEKDGILNAAIAWQIRQQYPVHTNIFKMLNLKPHYNSEIHLCIVDQMFDPVPSYNVISAVDLFDGVKVSQFFNLSPECLLKWLNKPKIFAVADCMEYLETKRSEGFTTFVNCMVYCGRITNNNLCGSHVLIALQESETDEFLRFLGELQNGIGSDYQCPEGGNFNVLFDYKHRDNVSYAEFFKPLFQPFQGRIQRHLILGERGKSETSSDPTPESSRLECFLIGRKLLNFLTQRLKLTFDLGEVLKRNGDIQVELPAHSYLKSGTSFDATNRTEEVTGVVEKLPPLLAQLSDASNPMAIKEVETSIAELLTVLKHFCYFSKEPAEKSVLLDIQSKVEELDYTQDSGLWCIKDDGEKELRINGPVIRVPRSKVKEFRRNIGEQRVGLFPIVIVPDAEEKPDVILDFQQPSEQYILKFIHSTQVNGQPDNSKTFRIPCNRACFCKPDEKSAWICKKCQMVLFVTPKSVIQCLCSVYDRSNIQCSADCVSRVALNNGKNNTKVDHCGNQLQQKNHVDDTWDNVSDARKAVVHVHQQLRRASGMNSGRPISSDGQVSDSAIEVSQNQKHHQPIPETNAKPEKLIVPKEKPIYTVAVTGASGAGKSTLLNSIYCMQQNGTFDNALKTEKLDYLLPVKIEEEIDGEKRIIEFGLHGNENEVFSSRQSTTQCPSSIIEYDDFKIRFVSTPGTNDTRNDGVVDQDKINIDMIRKHLLELDQIHAVVFVIKTTEPKLTPDFANTICCMLEMLPRRALKNCCFVYTFSAVNPNFTPGNARQALSTFFEDFCHRHHLPPLELTTENQFCVDNEAFRNISIHHQGYGINDAERYRSSWDKTALNVDLLLDRIKSLDPVTQKEFQRVKLLTELGDAMRLKMRSARTSTPQMKMLMATVAETNLSEIAIFCRRNSDGVEPIGPTTIGAVINYWKREDSHISEILTDLKSFLTNCYEVNEELDIDLNLTTNDLQNDDSLSADIIQTTQPSESVQPNHNVLILGSSSAKKQFLLNTLCCVHRYGSIDDVGHNAETITFPDSNDYMVDYGTHTIRYISKDVLDIEQFDIHGIMIVVENSTIELSNSNDNYIRETFNRLPRHAVKSCCIVNIFNPSDTFVLKDANEQMSELMTLFCSQHEMTDQPNYICLDTVKILAILSHNVIADVEGHQNIYESCKHGINAFLQIIQVVQPITPNELKVADSWKRLCDAFRPYIRGRDSETLRLMATIAENTTTGLAIYCRRNKAEAKPISKDEWPAAVAYWNSKDTKDSSAATIVTVLNEIYNP